MLIGDKLMYGFFMDGSEKVDILDVLKVLETL